MRKASLRRCDVNAEKELDLQVPGNSRQRDYKSRSPEAGTAGVSL